MDSQINVFGLLVGISDYPFPIQPLKACLNDVQLLTGLIHELFPNGNCVIETLLNEEAIRANIIGKFESHLGQAKEDDVAWFHFSGHGSRRPTANDFIEAGLSPEGLDETLICFDSRSPGGRDLADKEIAVLIERVAALGARVILTFDCCHSGGITRRWKGGKSIPFGDLARRQVQPSLVSTPIQDYLDGYYSRLAPLSIPEAPHIVFSACQGLESAYETNGNGVFTQQLVNAFDLLGPDPKINDLHDFVRSKVQQSLSRTTLSQTPHLEVYGNVDPGSTLFLNRHMEVKPIRKAFIEGGKLAIPFGAMEGLQNDSQIPVLNFEKEIIGTSIAKSVGIDRSVLLAQNHFQEPLFVELPSPMDHIIRIHLEINESTRKVLFPNLQSGRGFRMSEVERGNAEFEITESKEKIHLWQIHSRTSLIDLDPNSSALSVSLASAFEKIVRWRRAIKLKGKGIPLSKIRFYFQNPETGLNTPGNHLCVQLGNDRRKKIYVMGQNQSRESFFFTLLNFNREFGIQAFPSILVPPQSPPFIIYGQSKKQYFYLPDDYQQTSDTLRLLVSKEEPVWSLLGHRGVAVRAMSQGGEGAINRWGFKDLWLRLESEDHC